MEFFAIADVTTQPKVLQKLSIAELNQYCSEIDKVLQVVNENHAEIYCLWGKFTVHKQLINGGIRFSMPDCPNALAWTITTGFPPATDKIVIHCTINRTEHDADFIESIEAFLHGWKLGLEKKL
jgi:hypothetical protein